MILIADSGSTKTDWCAIQEEGVVQRFTTQGINPFHQSPQEIAAILHQEVIPGLEPATACQSESLKAEAYTGKAQPNGSPDKVAAGSTISGEPDGWADKVEAIFFYGAGCTPEKAVTVHQALQHVFAQAQTVEVNSDMLGAARALCGNRPGIACILGTGSNSCYYDGTRIQSNVPPLGYILGDEGSGAALGKRLVGDCLKKQLPEALCKKFLSQYALTQQAIIDKVYRQPMPNRFLASLSQFLHENRHEASIHRLLVDSFSDFIRRNVCQYPAAGLCFTGSIAYYYADELKEAAAACRLSITAIQQRPMEGLITYHTQKQTSWPLQK